MVAHFLEERFAVDDVEGIGEVDLEDSLLLHRCCSVFKDAGNSVDCGLTASLDAYTELVGCKVRGAFCSCLQSQVL